MYSVPMAMQPLQAETDEIGDHLQAKYADKDPNTHIRDFYIRFGNGTAQSGDCEQEAIDILYEKLGLNYYKPKPGWDRIVFFEGPGNGLNEREYEEFLNETIRKPLLRVGPHIMFSRACLYKDALIQSNNSDTITTRDIGAIMDNVYEPYGQKDPGNAHIEYFYLFVQATIGQENFVEKEISGKNINIHTMALTVLKGLPGDWKSVESDGTWQGTFLGFFPKGMQETTMTEREREKLLNGEVRLPLIKQLEDQLTGLKPKVQVIITRACRYTPSRMDTS